MKGIKYTLTEKQEAWLKRHFRNTKNADLCERLGISETALHRFARKLGLTKTKRFMKKMQANAAAKARESHLAFNTYPPKGYRIPRSEEFQFKPGVRPVDRLGKRREAKRVQRSVETRRKTFRFERARATFGLPQKTKLRVKQQPRQKILDRSYLKQRGYIIDEKEMVAYWTGETRRAVRLEAKPKRYYRFEPLPER